MKTRSHSIEPLEARIAPATLTGQVLTYQDIDGDQVAITFSKGTFNALMFGFDVGGVTGDNTMKQQLEVIGVSAAADVDGANITMKVTKAAGGDGLAHVGMIDANGRDLGAVTIVGDLGAITSGDGTTDTGFGLKSLSVRSLGRFGTATGALANGDGTLESHITGALGALTVKGDVNGVWVHVSGNGVGDEANGTIGAVTVGGSLLGGNTKRAGAINASGDIGAVKIARDIIGGTFEAAGFLQSDTGKIKSVTLGGSLLGGTATFTGEIRSGRDMGPVKIAGDVRGGAGQFSGFIATDTGFGPDNGSIASITIGGSLTGGAGKNSGDIRSTENIGAVKIRGDVRGGGDEESGRIRAMGTMGNITIGGGLIGGAGKDGGQIFSDDEIGAVKIGHSVQGGAGDNSGLILCVNGTIGSVTIGGSLVGGAGVFSGGIDVAGPSGAMKIGGDVLGGAGDSSGRIKVFFKLPSLTIGGSFIGGSFADGTHNSSGFIRAGEFGPVKIGHDLIGGSISGTATSIGSGQILSFGRIASVSIGGSIVSGVDGSTGDLLFNATIGAARDIGSLVVKGDIIGHDDTGNGRSPVFITAVREENPTDTRNLAIGSINVGGNVEQARIFAGYGLTLDALNGDAQIGKVTVGGDWIASNLVAGIADTGSDGFGNGTEEIIGGGTMSIAKIASIVIKGGVIGTAANPADHFGFESHTIGSFKAAGFTAPLTTATTGQFFELSLPTDDVTVREI